MKEDSKTYNKYGYCKSFLQGMTKHVLTYSTICSQRIYKRIMYTLLKMVEATQIEKLFA
jgi:hypothetical protein